MVMKYQCIVAIVLVLLKDSNCFMGFDKIETIPALPNCLNAVHYSNSQYISLAN